MKKFASFRTWVAPFVALCLLFAQLATAAYACPQLSKQAELLASDASAMMVDCDDMSSTQMDNSQPSLCKAHCQTGQQSHDSKGGADVPMASMDLVWTLLWVLAPVQKAAGLVGFSAYIADRPRDSAPIYLINQVFRL